MEGNERGLYSTGGLRKKREMERKENRIGKVLNSKTDESKKRDVRRPEYREGEVRRKREGEKEGIRWR